MFAIAHLLTFASSSILADSPLNSTTAQRSSERLGSNRPPRPERYAEEPPGIAAFAVLLAQLTLCPIASPSPADLRPPFRPTQTVPVFKQTPYEKET